MHRVKTSCRCEGFIICSCILSYGVIRIQFSYYHAKKNLTEILVFHCDCENLPNDQKRLSCGNLQLGLNVFTANFAGLFKCSFKVIH